MIRSDERKSKTIDIGKEAYFYLRNLDRTLGGYAPFDEEGKERVWKKMYKNERGLVNVYDDSFRWSVDTIKKMLDKEGLPFEEGGEITFFTLSI